MGNDVWIGYGATILGPVTIGNGAIVGTASVVVKDVPPYAIVGGNPARVIKMRFFNDVIDALERIRWWEWDDDVVLRNYQWFERPIEEFVERFDPKVK